MDSSSLKEIRKYLSLLDVFFTMEKTLDTIFDLPT